MAAERGGVGWADCCWTFDGCDFGAGAVPVAAAAAAVVVLDDFLLDVRGVSDNFEKSLGVFGCDEEEGPKRERAHLVVSPSTGVVCDAVVERDVLDEECERFEVSSAPEEVTS